MIITNILFYLQINTPKKRCPWHSILLQPRAQRCGTRTGASGASTIMIKAHSLSFSPKNAAAERENEFSRKI